MLWILFASFCMTTEAGQCVERVEWAADAWSGPTAQADCEAELLASHKRLEHEGIAEHFDLRCEARQ